MASAAEELELRSEPLYVLRHSTAHLLAAAVTQLWPGTKYAIGPPVENGFYYDFLFPGAVGEADLRRIEKKMGELVRRDLPYEQVVFSREQAIERFRALGQDFKLEVLAAEAATEQEISCYATGEFIDLCRGPHVDSTRRLANFKLTKISGAYWRADEKNAQLTRIYGTAWPDRQSLDDYLAVLAEAEKRDHKRLGPQLKLFRLDERTGQGMVIWLPHGATVRRELERWIVDEELARGYQHVVTPVVAKLDLFRQSGHFQKFQETMFPPMRTPEGEELELRPMNCPHHILVYEAEPRSYRDLPLRIAEIGNMYRWEKSGELMGMIRVRSIALNDAHIFCTPDQLQEELRDAIELAQYFMRTLGVQIHRYRLSIRDEQAAKWVGADEEWRHAESALAEALDASGERYEVGRGEAAFYGPKLDFQILDAQRREFTNNTVQVDFQLPLRFGLEYIAADGSRQTPIMVHRGALGALERFTAYLIEHYAGAFPTWLAPVQVGVLPITDAHVPYAKQVAERLRRERLRVEVDARPERVGKKIAEGRNRRLPYLAVVGEREAESGSVQIRDRAGAQSSEELEAFVERVATEVRQKRL